MLNIVYEINVFVKYGDEVDVEIVCIIVENVGGNVLVLVVVK